MVKMSSFWGQNYVIGQNLGNTLKKNFLQKFGKIISVRFIDTTLVKNVFNGGKFGKNRSFFYLGPPMPTGSNSTHKFSTAYDFILTHKNNKKMYSKHLGESSRV